MTQVRIQGGSTYQDVETPMTTTTRRVRSGYTTQYKPAFSFFGIPFGRRAVRVPKYEEQSFTVPVRTPVSSYGVNDTGRTLPFNPNPTSSNYRTTQGPGSSPYRAPQWAGGGESQQYQGGSSPDGLLGFLFGRQEPYEAALRERPGDIQNLVSMTRKPSFGAPVDPNSAFNRQRG